MQERCKRRRLCVAFAMVAAAIAGSACGAEGLNGQYDEVGVTEQELTAAHTAIFMGHRYQLFDSPATWQEANAYCQAQSGYLTDIGDAEENEFVRQLIADRGIYRTWIGYTDAAREGAWRWTSGSTATYKNWSSGEPNDANGNEDWAELTSNGSWNDLPGNWTAAFVCERNLSHAGDFAQRIRRIETATNKDARLGLFAVLEDYTLQAKFQKSATALSGSWSSTWTPLGAPSGTKLTAALAAVRHSDGKIYVFSQRASDNRLVYRAQSSANSSSFGSWKSVYTSGLYGNLVASTYSDKSLVVFGRRGDGKLYAMRRSGSGSWNSAVALGDQSIDQKFAVGKQADGRLVVFMSKGGCLYSLPQTGTKTWASAYAQVQNCAEIDPAADIAVTLNADNLLQVFVNLGGETNTHDVLTTWQNGSGGWAKGWYWLIDNVDKPMLGWTGANKRMVAARSGITNRPILAFVRVRESGGVIQQPLPLAFVEKTETSWTETAKLPPIGQETFIYPDLIGENNVVTATYASGAVGFFIPMNYSNTQDLSDDIYVHGIRETSTMSGGYTEWYHVGVDFWPAY